MRTRDEVAANTPVHVRLRVTEELGGLRKAVAYRAIAQALRVALRRPDFRIVHASIQRDHIHLICEADDASALARGMKSFQVSAAQHLNTSIGRERRGTVFPERYYVEPLETTQAVRDALVHVLNNWRVHEESAGRSDVDAFSSAGAFDGWSRAVEHEPPAGCEPLPLARPFTTMLATAWRRHDLVDPREVSRYPEHAR